MNRFAFIRRMALAAAACAFIDVKWPEAERIVGKTWYVMEYDGSLTPYRRGNLQSVSQVLSERDHAAFWSDWRVPYPTVK